MNAVLVHLPASNESEVELGRRGKWVRVHRSLIRYLDVHLQTETKASQTRRRMVKKTLERPPHRCMTTNGLL